MLITFGPVCFVCCPFVVTVVVVDVPVYVDGSFVTRVWLLFLLVLIPSRLLRCYWLRSTTVVLVTFVPGCLRCSVPHVCLFGYVVVLVRFGCYIFVYVICSLVVRSVTLRYVAVVVYVYVFTISVVDLRLFTLRSGCYYVYG
jgi:hypothetical protein